MVNHVTLWILLVNSKQCRLFKEMSHLFEMRPRSFAWRGSREVLSSVGVFFSVPLGTCALSIRWCLMSVVCCCCCLFHRCPEARRTRSTTRMQQEGCCSGSTKDRATGWHFFTWLNSILPPSVRPSSLRGSGSSDPSLWPTATVCLTDTIVKLRTSDPAVASAPASFPVRQVQVWSGRRAGLPLRLNPQTRGGFAFSPFPCAFKDSGSEVLKGQSWKWNSL